MSQTSNVAVVQDAYGKFKTGDLSGLLALMDPQITWQLPEVANVRIAGRRDGIDNVRQFFTNLGEDQETLSFEPRELVGGTDDTVVALGHYRWRVRATNKEWSSDFAHVFTVRGGRVTSFREFMDTAAVAEAYR